MKSEHRHDLQTNDLGKLMVQAEPFVEKYGAKILGGIGALLVLLIVLIIWNSQKTSAQSEAWTRLAAAGSTEDFENVAEDFAGTPVANWALIHAAESHLQSGIRSSFTDRSAGDRELKDAKEQFQKLLDSSSTPPEIRERALFGMARVEETTSNGDLKTATELYQKLINEFPESIFRQLAEQRVKPVEGEKVAALDEEGTKEFYKWFHEQNPKPGDRQRPGFNMPMPGMAPQGTTPAGGADTPGLPSLPGLPEPLTSEEGKASEGTPAAPEKTEAPKTEGKPAPEAGKAPAEQPKAEQPKSEAPKPEPAPEKKNNV